MGGLPLLACFRRFISLWLGNHANTTSIDVAQLPPTQMHGYKLDIEVKERYDGINYWRNVRGCNVTTVERLGAPTAFFESYHLFATESAGAAARPGLGSAAALVLAAAVAAAQQVYAR